MTAGVVGNVRSIPSGLRRRRPSRMMRKFHVVRIKLSDGRKGLFLGPVDAILAGPDESPHDQAGSVSDPVILVCDDQMPIGDLWLLSEEPGRLQ